jgi:hypothetical protein
MVLSQILDVFRVLTYTLPLYSDSASREAVEAVGMALITADESLPLKQGVTEQILGWLTTEVSRIGSGGTVQASRATTDLFVLLSWACGIYGTCLKVSDGWADTRSFNVTLGLVAILLDFVVSGTRVRPVLQRSAITKARRTLRSVSARLRCQAYVFTTGAVPRQTRTSSAVPSRASEEPACTCILHPPHWRSDRCYGTSQEAAR